MLLFASGEAKLKGRVARRERMGMKENMMEWIGDWIEKGYVVE